MSVRFKKIHPALKHAGYSATTLLPGEDRTAFEKLHRALIAEFTPVGALEEDIVADLARLVWRKQNLATFRIAGLADARREQIKDETVPRLEFRIPGDIDADQKEEARRAADEQARQELGDIHQLIDIGESATFDGLMRELFNAAIAKIANVGFTFGGTFAGHGVFVTGGNARFVLKQFSISP